MVERDDERRRQLFAQLAESGSTAVRNELVESYIPLAEFFANRYRTKSGFDDDLRQVAQMALVKAVDRFDPSFGVQFSTFAGRTIDGELKRYFRDKSWAVRVPRSLQELALEVRNAVNRLSVELGRSPTVDELAAETGHEVEIVLQALDVHTARQAQSIDRSASADDDAPTVASSLGDLDPNFERSEAMLAVRSLLETLPERERAIVEMRFFEGLTQQSIADQMGMSQMHVSRLLRRALESLRSEHD